MDSKSNKAIIYSAIGVCTIALAACGATLKSVSEISSSDAGNEIQSVTGVVQPKKPESPKNESQKPDEISLDELNLSFNYRDESYSETNSSYNSHSQTRTDDRSSPTSSPTQAPPTVTPPQPSSTNTPAQPSPPDQTHEDLDKIDEWNDDEEIVDIDKEEVYHDDEQS